jgi:hypothetical protein
MLRAPINVCGIPKHKRVRLKGRISFTHYYSLKLYSYADPKLRGLLSLNGWRGSIDFILSEDEWRLSECWVALIECEGVSIIQAAQALKYRSVTDIVRPIREIVRRKEETTGHSVRPKWNGGLLFVRHENVLVSDRTVALSNVNQNVP